VLKLKSECKKIKEIIGFAKSFLVAAHKDPDGDALGSTLAVASYLKSIGKEVVIYNADGVPQNLKFLKNSDLVQNSVPENKSFDATFVLDCSEFSRISENFPTDKNILGQIVNIDHHVTANGLGDVNLIDPEISSTGELLHRMLKIFGADINMDIAEPLYTAIFADTGSFRYSNSSPQAFQAASELVALGVKPWKVAQEIYENVPSSKLKLTSAVLSTLEIFDDEKFASVTLLNEMIDKSGALPEFSDGLVNYPRSVLGIEVSLIIKEVGPDKFKIGLRSKGTVDVSQIALSFGGGGHKNAAGCEVSGNLKQVKEKVYEKTRHAVRKAFGNNTDQ